MAQLVRMFSPVMVRKSTRWIFTPPQTLSRKDWLTKSLYQGGAAIKALDMGRISARLCSIVLKWMTLMIQL